MDKETATSRFEDFTKVRVLPELITHHLGRHDDLPALTEYVASEKAWVTLSYRQLHERIQSWEKAFAKLGLEKGSRVAMLLNNCVNAICFDQAAIRRGLVTVPLHAVDTPGSSAYILDDSQCRVLVTAKYLKWKNIRQAETLPNLKLVVITDDELQEDDLVNNNGVEVVRLEDWLAAAENESLPEVHLEADDLVNLVYTSGTTGRPKGVMLTHTNILECDRGVLKNICPRPGDVWFSFLPLSHTLERATSYYMALGMGNHVYFNRNILQIMDDLKVAKPTILVSVPRIYETIYARLNDKLSKQSAVVRYVFNWAVEVGWRRFCKQNHLEVEHTWREFMDPMVANWLDGKVGKTLRAVFGGANAHAYISGGAALNAQIARVFIGLGIPLYQGYGLTETAPVLSVNTEGNNNPATVGPIIDNMQARLGDNDELQVKGPLVMKGYWNRPDATKDVFTEDGWFRTGDQADILPTGHVRIKGRIKEIIVTSTGEKIPPGDLEMAMQTDPLFAQTMAIGENLPFISALIVLDPKRWEKMAADLGLDPADPQSLKDKKVLINVVKRLKKVCHGFPQYGVPRSAILTLEPWTIDNGMLTPTLKLKRHIIKARYQDRISELYAQK